MPKTTEVSGAWPSERMMVIAISQPKLVGLTMISACATTTMIQPIRDRSRLLNFFSSIGHANAPTINAIISAV